MMKENEVNGKGHWLASLLLGGRGRKERNRGMVHNSAIRENAK